MTADDNKKEVVIYTPEKLARLKKAHEESAGAYFEFDGEQYYAPFAKYLIEFLEEKFNL